LFTQALILGYFSPLEGILSLVIRGSGEYMLIPSPSRVRIIDLLEINIVWEYNKKI
jgi:hypothetical protein